LVLTRLHDGHPHLSPGMKKVRFLQLPLDGGGSRSQLPLAAGSR
jgi:hypothetical protein